MINDNNTIANNAIFDFFGATLATNGINVFANEWCMDYFWKQIVSNCK
jgi:hypothetical protein